MPNYKMILMKQVELLLLVMMTLLKLARIKNGQVSNADNYVDAAGYMACSGEIAGKQSDE